MTVPFLESHAIRYVVDEVLETLTFISGARSSARTRNSTSFGSFARPRLPGDDFRDRSGSETGPPDRKLGQEEGGVASGCSSNVRHWDSKPATNLNF